MKKIMNFSIVTLLLLFSIACSKDSSVTLLQGHDANRMMDSMHALMDRMEAMPKTNDPDIDFPKMMILHHQGAINMAAVQMQESKNDSLKRFSQKMTAAQQMEIEQLTTIVNSQTSNNTVLEFTKEQMAHMMKMGQMADVQLITGNIDNDFATLMILHHNSALENAEAYILYGSNAELKAMAKKMIEDQTKEIKELSDWLKANKR